MLNKVLLIGRLGRDPEKRYTANGTPVTSFSLATAERWKDGSGEQKERTEWHNIVAWGKLADLTAQYLSKGRMAYVEGKIQTREWEDKEGNKKSTKEIVASSVIFLSPKSERDESPQNPNYGTAEPAPTADDSDVPF